MLLFRIEQAPHNTKIMHPQIYPYCTARHTGIYLHSGKHADGIQGNLRGIKAYSKCVQYDVIYSIVQEWLRLQFVYNLILRVKSLQSLVRYRFAGFYCIFI